MYLFFLGGGRIEFRHILCTSSSLYIYIHNSTLTICTGWWFQTWILFSIIYGMSSFPLTFIFFKMVKTTNHCKNPQIFYTSSTPPGKPGAGECGIKSEASYPTVSGSAPSPPTPPPSTGHYGQPPCKKDESPLQVTGGNLWVSIAIGLNR